MVSLQAAVLALVLGSGQTELLDFSATWCGPCRQMEPIIKELSGQGYTIRKIDIDQNRALASQYHITGVPCFVMLVDGQEVDRIIGATSREQLEQLLQLGTARPSQAAIAAAEPHVMRASGTSNAQAGDNRQPAPGKPASMRIPSVVSGPPLVAVTRPARSAAVEPSLTSPGPVDESVAQTSENSSSAPPGVAKRLLAASVRLKIEDPNGRSVGSGTIIDARSGEALILTCGHVFRDSQGQGKITVDLFGPGAPQNIPARLVSYDLKTDLGLLAIRTGTQVAAVPLAPANTRFQPRDAVTNVGCNHGADPTARASQITSVNKYLGTANLQVAGQPVEGRSGGGLFNAAGQLIGVCNAADPADNEGLYAALPAIYSQLEQLGLRQLIEGSKPTDIAAAADSAAVAAMPDRMPPTDLEPGKLATALNPREATVLGELKDKSAGAEVICIVRSLTDPRAKSEIIVLDRASPDFLESLAADRERQQGRRLTSMTVKNQRPAVQPAPAWQPNWKPGGGPVAANSPAKLADDAGAGQ